MTHMRPSQLCMVVCTGDQHIPRMDLGIVFKKEESPPPQEAIAELDKVEQIVTTPASYRGMAMD